MCPTGPRSRIKDNDRVKTVPGRLGGNSRNGRNGIGSQQTACRREVMKMQNISDAICMKNVTIIGKTDLSTGSIKIARR